MRHFQKLTNDSRASILAFMIWGLAFAIGAYMILCVFTPDAFYDFNGWLQIIILTEVLTVIVFGILIRSSPKVRGLGFTIVGLLLPLSIMLLAIIIGKFFPDPSLPPSDGLAFIAAIIWGVTIQPLSLISTFTYYHWQNKIHLAH